MQFIGPGFGPIGPGPAAAPVQYAGGAIYLGPDCINVNIRNSQFHGNAAWTDGGAIRCLTDAAFSNCVFGGNKTRDHGGAIDVFCDTNDPNTRRILTLDLKSAALPETWRTKASMAGVAASTSRTSTPLSAIATSSAIRLRTAAACSWPAETSRSREE